MKKISVLLPVYNAEKYIAHTVKSVLQQSYSNFELIAVDDGSKDNSLEILTNFSDPRLKVYFQENQGLATTLNLAFKYSNGEFLARIDADDICIVERFKKQIDYLDKHLDVAVVGSAVEYIDYKGDYIARSFPPTSHRTIRKKILNGGCCLTHPSVLMRADVFRQVGGYDERSRCAQDLFLWSKMVSKGYKLKNLPMPLIKYRLADDAVSSIYVDKEYDYLKNTICKQPFDVSNDLINQFNSKYLELKITSKKSPKGRMDEVLFSRPFRIYQCLLRFGLPSSLAESFVYFIRSFG